MIHLNYRLTQEEAVQYYEMIGSNAKETSYARILTTIWVPALMIVLLIAFKLYKSILWIMIAVFLSFFWATFLAPKMYRDVVRTAASRKIDEKNINRETIDIKEENGLITVNGIKKTPLTYAVYYELFVIAFTDGSNLIVPTRAFENNEKKMEQFMSDVVKYVEENKQK